MSYAIELTPEEPAALIPEKPANVSALSSAHNKMRAKLRELQADLSQTSAEDTA